jgi:hypothetical protein
MDLSNEWLRRDVGTVSVYYGYSRNVASTDSDRSWSILKISTVGTVDSVSWNDNSKLEYIGVWNDRVANFTTPTGSLGITYSKTVGSFNTVSINSSWSYLTGVNTYKISVTDQNGVLYNSMGSPFLNNYATESERITTIVKGDNRFVFNGTSGMTYSFTLTGVNPVGSSASTVTITT